jgi:hypothetical protein
MGYVVLAKRPDPWNRVVGNFRQRSAPHRRRLGDTCWTDPTTGGRVCGATDVTQQVVQPVCINANTPQNKPTIAPSSQDNSAAQITGFNGAQFQWMPSSRNPRTFNFVYHSGTSDVYQLAAGQTLPFKTPYGFAVVAPTGIVTFAQSAPVQQEPPCNIQTPYANNQPQPGSSTTCYTSSSGQLICGAASTIEYPAASATSPTYPYGYYSSSPYVSTAAPAAAAPASSGFSLSNLPTWALLAGGAGGMFVLSKFMGGRR